MFILVTLEVSQLPIGWLKDDKTVYFQSEETGYSHLYLFDTEKNKKKHITISITDNGVGRKASREINKQKTLKRKSVGIALTKERLENFSKRYTKMYNIKIKDLQDEQGNALGTKVILDIPIHLIPYEKD